MTMDAAHIHEALRPRLKRFLSVCSGIEAASIRLGTARLACRGVRRDRTLSCSRSRAPPSKVPNLGDMTKFRDRRPMQQSIFSSAEPPAKPSPSRDFAAGLADQRGQPRT